AKDVLSDLDRSAIATSGRAHWAGRTLTYGSWQSNNTETTAYVLRAFLAIDPSNTKVADTVAWLVEHRQGSGEYTTTKDTAAVVLSLAEYVKLTNELDPSLDVTVTINAQATPIHFATGDLSKKPVIIRVPSSSL